MCQSENIYSDKHKKHSGICNFAPHQIMLMFFMDFDHVFVKTEKANATYSERKRIRDASIYTSKKYRSSFYS